MTYSLSFTLTDAGSTDSGELQWGIYTAASAGGTLLASGSATSGVEVVTGTITDTALVLGDNTRWLYAIDGAGNVLDEAFTVRVSPPSPAAIEGAGTTLITLTHTDTITVSLPCRRRWSLTLSGQVGDATFTIPSGSPAFSTAYVNAEAGSLVHIAGRHGSGDWNGIITGISYDDEGATVTAMQPAVILSRIPAALHRTYRGVFPHDIVRTAFNAVSSAAGNYPLATGQIALGMPLIEQYSIAGTSVWSVLLDMMGMSGHEVQVRTYSPSGNGRTTHYNEHENRPDTLIWGGITNPTYSGVLLAPGQLHEASYGVDISEQASRVTALAANRYYTAASPGVAVENLWPAHVVVNAGGSENVALVAENEATRRLRPAVTITGAVPTAHWTIREGDFLRVLIPWAGFDGATALVRVISREIDEAGDLMHLQLATTSDPRNTNRVLDALRQVQRDQWRLRVA